MELPNKGSLADANFFHILRDASASSLTGMVRVESGNVIKVVYMQEGNIAFASSNDKSDRLTEVLKRAGKLTPEQIEHAQARMRPNVSLGKTLVELGYISAKDLLWGARTQVEGILHQLLFWIDGHYQILQGPLPKEIVSLNIPAQRIIYDGVLKTNDRQWVLEHIGSPESVYTLGPEYYEVNATYQFSADNVVSRLNGKRTLEEVAQTAGMDTFEVCKTVTALQLLGLARRVEKAVQMQLSVAEDMSKVMEETPAPADLSLGQVLQIPTVAELQQREESESTFEVEESETATEESAVPERETESFEEQPMTGEPPREPEAERSELPRTNALVPESTLSEPESKPEPQPEPTPFEPAPPTPPSFPQRQGVQIPMEGLSLTTRRRAPTVQSEFSWRKAALITAIVGLALVGGFAGYSRYQQGRTADRTPRVDVESAKPLKAPEQQETPIPQEVVEPLPVEQQKEIKPAPPATASAFDNLKTGNVQKAAVQWQSELRHRRSGYTIQLEIACQTSTVMEALQLTGGSQDLIVVPMTFQGKSCYRVLFGLYSSAAAAEGARGRVPQEFLRQASPAQVLPLSKVLKE